MLALQDATEAFTMRLLERSGRCALHARRLTVQLGDVALSDAPAPGGAGAGPQLGRGTLRLVLMAAALPAWGFGFLRLGLGCLGFRLLRLGLGIAFVKTELVSHTGRCLRDPKQRPVPISS